MNQPIRVIERMRLSLLKDGKLCTSFVVLTVTSCLIATFGLLSNSTAVIIGAMIVAPLMMPLRGLAFGALDGDPQLFRTCLISLIMATLIGLFLSGFCGSILDLEFGSEILARTQPNLIDLGIALTAGGLSAFVKIRPKEFGDAMAGTAIAVALMPPLCVVGISLANGEYTLAWGAFLLYLTNLLGITFACMLVFFFAGYFEFKAPYHQPHHVLMWAVVLITILVIPLGISLTKLITQSQIQNVLKRNFLYKTFTGRRVELISSKIYWTTEPIQVVLRVRSIEPITRRQVQLVEKFLEKSLQRRITLILQVSEEKEIKGGYD